MAHNLTPILILRLYCIHSLTRREPTLCTLSSLSTMSILQFFSAPLDKMRSLLSRPPTSAPGVLPTRSEGPTQPTLQRARPLSSASSITLGPRGPTRVPPDSTNVLAATLEYQSDQIANFWGGYPVAPDPRRSPGESADAQRKPRKPSVSTFEVEEAQRTREEEPKTRARTMFFWGFVLPLLWLVGVYTLFCPTKYEPDLESAPVGSAEEMKRHKAAYRAAEEKWARRCLWMLISLLAVLSVVIITVVLAMKNMERAALRKV
ncbi:hypothetical protein C8Q78DRAFT_224862 [Trametes maxima]|nr:hypothetical protein C8Q78DRAFT_224862 [Trametes maxima]